MISKIKRHFQQVDPVLYSAIKKLDLLEKADPENYFAKLCGEIINQQLSDKASATIFARFKKLYPGGKITPRHTLKLSHEDIRSVGPSNAKVKFIRELAQKVVNGEVNLEKFDGLNDEAVITELTKIKGIGPWTAEMFMMFSLGRTDIFSHGDLGLKKAIKKLYGFKKDPSRERLDAITKKWSPYRTYACLVLWQVIDG